MSAAKKDPNRPKKTNRVLPETGAEAAELLQMMRLFKTQDDARWKDGQLSGAVYHGEDDHIQLLNEAAGLFSVSNPLHSSTWPSVNKFEAEVIAMTASLVNGGDEGVCGTITSGGTESVLMAAKTHRQWGELEKGIKEPEIIAAGSAHAAIDKACDMLRIKLVRVPILPGSCEMDVAAARAAVTPNTVMIYASAPNYPQGTIDPIAEIAAVAEAAGCGLHVDCCLGGFFLPFARQLRDTIPEFDFALPGVTSMSCDTHKYGYATKGTSVVLYRSKELRKHQYFMFPRWQGGSYGTPSTAGSRPGTLIAATWASMMRLGNEGYLEATEKILQVVETLAAAVEAIDGIEIVGRPQAMVLAFGSSPAADGGPGFNIYRVAELLHKAGYHWASCQDPPCIHLCATLRHAGQEGAIIAAIQAAVAEVQATPSKPGEAEAGIAIYGEAGAAADAAKEDSLVRWMDRMLDMPPPATAETETAAVAAVATAGRRSNL